MCERFGYKPPDYKNERTWEDFNDYQKLQLLAYEQVRQYEETEEIVAAAGGSM